MTLRRIIDTDPFARTGRAWIERGNWPAKWIDASELPPQKSTLTFYRLPFSLEAPATIVVHVSADNRYRLFLDGKPIGRGPERGMPDYWFFETYDLELSAGSHVLSAMVWWLAGEDAPAAQMSIRSGFLVAAEEPFGALLSTGRGAWECAAAEGIEFIRGRVDPYWTGARVRIDASRFPWDRSSGTGAGWNKAITLRGAQSQRWTFETHPVWQLAPALLPPMMEEAFPGARVRYVAAGSAEYPVRSSLHLSAEAQEWELMLKSSRDLKIPPHTKRTVILETADYVCAYPRLCTSQGKGTNIRMHWAEAMFNQPHPGPKGKRDVVEGKFFFGEGDEFLPDGGDRRTFTTLWWELGRYIELLITTADEPLTIHSIELDETRYPFELKGRFRSSDPRLESVIPLALRALLMSSHENFADGPYYEQIMYIGDSRLEALVSYVMSGDGRLAKKALLTFDRSRLPSGLTQSRYPCRIRQVIPPFSLWYVTMAHDYFMWQNDPEFVRGLRPALRAITDAFRSYQKEDGLVYSPDGWNYVDWVPEWTNFGMPNGADISASSIINLQFVLALRAKAEIEDYFQDPLAAKRDRETAERVFRAVLQKFWSDDRMIADDLEQEHHSEHAQCLAILTGMLPDPQRTDVTDRLLNAHHVSRTTIYFAHYLFEAYRKLGRVDKIIERMQLWFQFLDHGFRTTPEQPEPTRSDCHGWGSHPIYHFHATLAGIRPAEPLFGTVEIAPLPGPLETIECETAHPNGMIKVHITRSGDSLSMKADLPKGLSGTAVWKGKKQPLRPGANQVSF